MTHVDVYVTGTSAKADVHGRITHGLVGATVKVHFDDSWDSLSPIFYCSCGGVDKRMALDANGLCIIPWECCLGGNVMRVGVNGNNASGSVVVPTIWASCGNVFESVAESKASEGETPPTPEMAEQVQAIAIEAGRKANQAAASAASSASSAASAQTSAATAQSIAQSVRADADAGLFDGEPGEPGKTPNIQIGTVESVPYTSPAEVKRSGTDENPAFSFKIPGGRPGEKGEPGRTPEKGVDYFDGEPGAPGYSPSAIVQREADGARITITDKSGTTSAKVLDGVGKVLSVNGQTGDVNLNAGDVGALPSDTPIPPDFTDDVNELKDKVQEIELFKFPNATIHGTPLIESGQVSGFSSTSYLIFPFILDVRSLPFSVDFCFTTGADVTTQQNILDSAFGLALAIRNGRGLMALSSDGQTFNLGQVSGTYPIAANRTYYARLSWDRAVYRTALSVDGVNYTNDMAVTSAAGLFPTTIYIGGSPDLFGAGTAHPFKGSINLNKSFMSINGQVFWQGMDDAGLSTRASVSLDNLDEKGEERFKTDTTLSVPGMPADAAETGKQMKPRGGVAIVFGDSLFENPGVYSFAEFLRGKGIYQEVVNHAVGGCCFKSTNPQLSLSDILLEEAVQADVARADEIWLHLGGNDITKRVFEGGSPAELGQNVSDCFSIIKRLNPDVLIRYVAPIPKPPELINTHAIKKAAYGDYTFTDADIANICESVFVIDLSLAYSEIPIVQCRKYCPDIVSETLDGTHPTTNSAQTFFESILSADFNGTRTIDYFMVTENDIGASDSFIADGKIAKNAVLCFFGSANSLAVIPMNTMFGKMTGSVILPDAGIVLKAEIENEHLLISTVPLNPAEKEWQLKGTITNPTERITVDMSGCTEMAIKGSSTGTGTSIIREQNSILLQICQKGTMNFTSHFINGFSGFECISGRYATVDTRNATGVLGAYSALDGKTISEINTLFLLNPQNVTSCNIEIWGR